MAPHLRIELRRLVTVVLPVALAVLTGTRVAPASTFKLYAGKTVDVEIVVDGEKCTERLASDTNFNVTHSLLRASGKESRFWVNTDAEGNYHWARPGKNSTYENLDDQVYLVTYILNSAGELVSPPRLFDVEWRDSTLVTGKEVAVAYSLSGERVLLRAGERHTEAITVGGETCTEILSFGREVKRTILRASGKKAALPVNSVPRRGLSWAHPGRNSTYLPALDTGPRVGSGWLGMPNCWSWNLYERVYVLDKAGRLREKVRYFEVGHKPDGTAYRGKEVTRGILPSY